MGKKSRRNKARKEPVPVEDAYAQPLIRYRHTMHYNVDYDTVELLTHECSAAEGISIPAVGEQSEDCLKPLGPGEHDMLAEFMYLVVFPAHKKLGLNGALRVVRRFPTFKPHWHRVRRRVCEYCGRRNNLSEPRLWVCGGCDVVRYCGEDCQAADFSHHEKCCSVLARRWDGVGRAPLKIMKLCADGTWKDPAVLPSASKRENSRQHRKRAPRIYRAIWPICTG